MCAGERGFGGETFVELNARWRYVYRVVDQHRQVIDVPREVTTDQAPTLARSVDELLPGARHDTAQYAAIASNASSVG